MAIPTIDILDITPDFIKKHIFMILLLGDTAVTTFFNFSTGSDFGGIIGSLLGFVASLFIGFAFGAEVAVLIYTWQILFLTVLYQAGIFGLLYRMMISAFAAGVKR